MSKYGPIKLVQDGFEALAGKEPFIGPRECIGEECIIVPVCQPADTLCQLTEYMQEKGYDIDTYHLPQVAQDGLTYVEDKTGFSPATTSIAIVSAASITGSLIGAYAAWKLYQRLTRECPAPVLAVIKDNEEWMRLYDALTLEAKAAMKQFDSEDAAEFFNSLKRTVSAQSTKTVGQILTQKSAEGDSSYLVKTIAATMRNNKKSFNEKKHVKHVAAAKAEALKAQKLVVKKPGAQSEGSSSTAQPAATWSWSPIGLVSWMWAAKKAAAPTTTTTVTAPVVDATAKKETAKM